MATLYSYVVEHDLGNAPNPFGGYCTLAKCKYSKSRWRKNVVELAEAGDWVAGTGGADLRKSAGHGRLIYAMRVDEKMPLSVYFHDKRFRGRKDNTPDSANRNDRFVLISQHFFYFGRNAIGIADMPCEHLPHSLEKKGPAYRKDFSQSFIDDFARWLKQNYTVGIHGLPCGYAEDTLIQIQMKIVHENTV